MIKFKSLSALTYMVVAILLAVTVINGFILYASTQAKQVALAKQRIELVGDLLAPTGESPNPTVISRRIATLSAQRDTGDLGMILSDRSGNVLAGNVRLQRKLPLGYSALDESDGIAGLSHGRALVRDLGNGLRLTLIVETEPFDRLYIARIQLYLLSFGSILVIVGFGLLALRRMIGERISRMQRTADAIVEGNLDMRVPLNGTGDEFDQQAAGINRMLDRISQLMAEMRNVTNDISHEMRGPFTRLRGQLALIAQRPEAASVQEDMNRAIVMTDEILAIFSALLRISEIESGRRRSGFMPVTLNDLVCEQVEMISPVAEEQGQSLDLGHCDPVTIRGDPHLLVQMVVNLLENAIRHCPQGTSIRLSLVHAGDHTRLIVEDDGPGIPPEQHKLVLRRFGQMEQSRSQSGYGLGMSLVDAIARLHGATLTLEDAAPGLRVVIDFPKATQEWTAVK